MTKVESIWYDTQFIQVMKTGNILWQWLVDWETAAILKNNRHPEIRVAHGEIWKTYNPRGENTKC